MGRNIKMPTRKKILKKKIKDKVQFTAYFFTEDESALAVPVVRNIVNAEDKARRVAKKLNKKLAGGYDTTGKPNWTKKIIKVPISTKPLPLPKKQDIVGNIMAYESGELSDKDTIKMFQRMVDTGQVWGLQGSYGRTANALIEQGLVKFPKKKTTDFYGNPIPTHKQARKTKLYSKLKRKSDMKKAMQNAFGDVATVM